MLGCRHGNSKTDKSSLLLLGVDSVGRCVGISDLENKAEGRVRLGGVGLGLGEDTRVVGGTEHSRLGATGRPCSG